MISGELQDSEKNAHGSNQVRPQVLIPQEKQLPSDEGRKDGVMRGSSCYTRVVVVAGWINVDV